MDIKGYYVVYLLFGLQTLLLLRGFDLISLDLQKPLNSSADENISSYCALIMMVVRLFLMFVLCSPIHFGGFYL